jgi:Protein of unknown function (DUF3072)
MDYEGEEEDRRDSNRVEDPDDWVTGDKEMTGGQESYLETLAREAHQRVEPDLTKAEASKKIDVLRRKTGLAARRHDGGHQKPSRGVS